MYNPTEAERELLPSKNYDDCKAVGWNNPGEPCKCAECGKPAKNLMGLRVHYQYNHLPNRPVNPGNTRKNKPITALHDGGLVLASENRKQQQPSSVTFCPGCGCNIKAVAMAMRLTQ